MSSYLSHTAFRLFRYSGALDLGPGPKAATKAPHGPGLLALCGPGPGPRPHNVKVISKSNIVIWPFHIMFISISYCIHIVLTFLGSRPRPGLQSSHYVHTSGHIIFISFSYLCAVLVREAFPYCNVCKSDISLTCLTCSW